MQASWTSLPFLEAIEFFKGKTNIPTATWLDLWQSMHDRAFSVAGAIQKDLIADLREAVRKGIDDGTTLEEFRRDFTEIVQKHGWSYNGGEGWRTAVIYNTNLRVAYAAGRYRQLTDPAVVAARPYWRYIGGLSDEPRPEHLAWSGTILPWNDPWFDTHYPPNGWGCKCMVVSVSESEIQREGWKLSQAPKTSTYRWENKKTGEWLDIPKGIDPGWAYNPGKTAWEKDA